MTKKLKNNLRKELQTALSAPTPTRKHSFLNTLSYKNPTIYDFVFSQFGYIGIRFWILSILLVSIIIFLNTYIQQGKEAVVILSSVMPLFTLLGLSEIYKSDFYNMSELEAVSKYDLSKLTLIRLSIIGTFHFAIILILMMLFKDKTHFGILRYSLYSITPFLLTTYLSFWISNHFKTQDTLNICIGVTLSVSCFIYYSNYNFSLIYNNSYIAVWLILFSIILVLLAKELNFLINRKEKLWSLV